jgi:hypothetical protein
LAAVAAAGLSACFIEAGSLAGKECRTAVDCFDPYVCVAARANGRRTCELLRGPDEAPPGGGGGPYDFCKDVKPLMDKSCVANCHGIDTTGSSQPSFRLDQYSFSSGFPLGAFAKAARVRARISDDSMPPAGFTPRLTTEERQVVTRWVDLGAPECFATQGMDSGTMTDGGSGGDQ